MWAKYASVKDMFFHHVKCHRVMVRYSSPVTHITECGRTVTTLQSFCSLTTTFRK